MNATPGDVTHYGVIGMGPIGSVIAAHLAKAGQKVSVLCASEKKTGALRSGPLRVTGALAAEVVIPGVYADLKEFIAAGPDVVVIATKSCDSPDLLGQIRECAPDSRMTFVSCQNGIDVEEQIVDRFGAGRALRMVMNIGCHLVSETEVEVVFTLRQVVAAVAGGPDK